MINQRYKIIKKIGTGRSDVFLCEDYENSRATFAIKILKPDVSEDEKENFRNEFFTLQKLEHPNIIRAEEFGTVLISENEAVPVGSKYITTEYFPSTELSDRKTIDENLLREITKQICCALYYLHQSNYIYYDLKLENILINSDEEFPEIKLIDLGLSQYSPPEVINVIRGTANYIAPELLKKEAHDFRVDIYSLGVLLYKLIYKKFPFECENELDIYKAQIENEIEFPPVENYSDELIEILELLLKKNPDERPNNTLRILELLKIKIDETIHKDFLPAKIFSGREDAINILNTYINDKSSSEVIVIKGFDNAGKTALLKYIYEIKEEAILFSDLVGEGNSAFVNFFIKKLFYSEKIFNRLGKNEINSIYKTLKNTNRFSSDQLFSIISRITKNTNAVLLVDDYNLLDDYTIEMFNSIMPVFQINGIKVILTETSEADYRSAELNNVREFSLGSFTDIQLAEFVNQTFHKSFPSNELNNLIINYSDLLPGNILSFIKDLIILQIMNFSGDGVSFSTKDEELNILEESHDSIYNRRLSGLSEVELSAVKTVSCFESPIEFKTLQAILEVSLEEFSRIISRLQTNNLLQAHTYSNTLQITSSGLKKHIYDLINNKKIWHDQIATKLILYFPNYSLTELAKQYELAGKYNECYKMYWKEIEQAEKNSAYTYIRKILFYLLELPLDINLITSVQVKLAEINYKLSDFRNSIDIIKKINIKNLPAKSALEIEFIHASSLIGSGDFQNGIDKLKALNNKINDPVRKNKLITEMAYAEFEMGQYSQATDYVHNIINDSSLDSELKGKCFNLLGMNEIYNTNNLTEALKYFKEARVNYENANLPRRIAGMEVNIGNIHNILGQYDKATNHWEIASSLNQSIGNLDQEGLLYINRGIFHFERFQLEQAVEMYESALKIFLSLGNFQNQGLALLNLGESYLYLCEYQKAYSSLNEAVRIFGERNLAEEEADTLFMLSKLYFKVELSSESNNSVKKYTKIVENNKFSGKHLANLELLNFYQQLFLKGTGELSLLIKIKEEYLKFGEKMNYAEVMFLTVKFLILKSNFEEAKNILQSSDFVEFCKQNVIFETERQYYLGKLSLEFGSDDLLPALEYFNTAYDMVKEESISEITWKILFALSELYLSRGNYQKAKSYFSYTRELIQYIIDRIETPRLRKSFSEKEEIKIILEKLESLHTI